jgi:hypothetical protein
MADNEQSTSPGAVPVVYGEDGTSAPANPSSAAEDVLVTSPELNVVPPRKPPLPTPIGRVGDGQTHQDTVVWPRDHFVLVDGPLKQDATLEFTETFSVIGPTASPGRTPTRAKQTTSLTSTARPLEEDKLVAQLYFSEHVEGSRMALVVTQGEARTLLFAGVTGDDFIATAQGVKKAARISEHLAVPFLLPAPPTVGKQEHRDRILAGTYTRMADIVAPDPKVE